MTFSPVQPRNSKGSPMAGAWRPDNQRGGAGVAERPAWSDMTLKERQIDITSRIQNVLEDHGLDDWGVRFNTAYTVLGSANYRTKQITISNPVLLESEEQSIDTAMHEAAHAIAGPGAKHGPEWQRVASELGASPKASTSAIKLERPKRSKTVTMHGLPYSFHEGVTTFERSGKTYTVDRVNRKNLIATRHDTGQKYQMPIGYVTDIFAKADEDHMQSLLDESLQEFSDDHGRKEALRALHGLSDSQEAGNANLRGRWRALRAATAQRGRHLLETTSEHTNRHVAELVAQDDWRGTMSRHRIDGTHPGGTVMEYIELKNSQGNTLNLTRIAPRERPTTTATVIGEAILDKEKFQRYGAEREAWEAAGEVTGRHFHVRSIAGASIGTAFTPTQISAYLEAAKKV